LHRHSRIHRHLQLPNDVVHPSRDQRQAASVDGGDQVFGALYGRRFGAAQFLQEGEDSGGGHGDFVGAAA